MPIYLYADNSVDVEKIRQKFTELLRNDEDWDGRSEPMVHVTAINDETIEVRALCSAADPFKAWYLHARLREQLLAFLRELEDGSYLPRRRLVIAESAAAASPSQPPVTSRQQAVANGRTEERGE